MQLKIILFFISLQVEKKYKLYLIFRIFKNAQ